MNRLEDQIDQIVREVIARLHGPNANGSQPTERTDAVSAAPQVKTSSVLVLQKRVVCAADVESSLSGISQLVVPRGAVITPAARDVLRSSKVEVTYQVTTKQQGSTKPNLSIALAETTFGAAALVQTLRKRGIEVQQLPTIGLSGVIQELADQVRLSGRLAALITTKPTAAVCLSNRQCGVRAAVGTSPASIKQAIKEVGANFLIVDPTDKSQFELQRTVAEFCTAGLRTCPPEYATQLS